MFTLLYSCFVHAWSLSPVRLLVTLWTVARQAPLSTGFFKQEYRSGLPFPPPGDLPDPGIKLGCPALQVDSLPTELQVKSTCQFSVWGFFFFF